MSRAAPQPAFRRAALPAFTVLVAAALRVYALGRNGFTQDEVASVLVATDLGSVANPLVGHAPFYYALLSLWITVGRSEFWIRTLSVVLGLGVILAVYRAAMEACGPRVARLAAWLVAVSPVAIWASREARAYVLLHLFAILAFWALLRGLRKGRLWDWVAHGAFVAAALYTHYYALFLIPAFALATFLSSGLHRTRTFLAFLGATTLAALLFLPWMPVLLAGQEGLAGYASEVNRFSTAASFPAKTALYLLARTDPPHMIGAALEALVPGRTFTVVSLVAYIVLFAFLGRRVAADGVASPLVAWLILAVVPTLTAVAGHYVRDVIISPRYVAFSGIFLAVPTAALAEGRSDRWIRAMAPLTLLLGVIGAWPLYAHPQSELREAVQYIDEQASAGDCVATVSNKSFYYRFVSERDLPAVDLPWEIPGVEREVTQGTRLANRRIRERDTPAILRYFRTCSITWVLYNEERVWGVDMGSATLRAALEEGGFEILDSRDFADTRVEAYRSRP